MRNLYASLPILSLLFASQTIVHAQFPQHEWSVAPQGIDRDGSRTVSFSKGTSIATDKDGNVYISGDYGNLVDFDPGPGFDTADRSVDVVSAFLVKYDAAGRFVWRRSIRGGRKVAMYKGGSVAVDGAGNVYQSGTFSDTAVFGTGTGSVRIGSSGEDMFITKYSPQGVLQWVKTVTVDIPNCQGCGIYPGNLAVDTAGNVYCGAIYNVTALTLDFDKTNPGQHQLPYSHIGDSYLAKYNSSGVTQWVRQITGGDGESINKVAISPLSGNIVVGGYVTGSYMSFPPQTTRYTSLGGTDGFIAEYTPGGSFIWARRIGGAYTDYINDLCVAKNGEIVITGISYLNPGMTRHEAFVTKLGSTGGVNWSRRYESASGSSLALDESGNIYANGTFSQTVNFNPAGPAVKFSSQAKYNDMFLLKLDPAGAFRWARAYTGNNAIEPRRICVDKGANIYATGTFYTNCNFNPGVPASELRHGNTTQGGYVVKFNQKSPFFGLSVAGTGQTPLQIAPNPAGRTIAIDGMQTGRQYKLRVIDMLGREYELPQLYDNRYSVEVLPPGAYLLQCHDLGDNSSRQLRFVRAAE